MAVSATQKGVKSPFYNNGRLRRAELVRLGGGCCQICGESRYETLHFHHNMVTRHQKSTHMTSGNLAWMSDEAKEKEFSLCSVVCNTCHSKIHKGVIWDASRHSSKHTCMVDSVGRVWIIRKELTGSISVNSPGSKLRSKSPIRLEKLGKTGKKSTIRKRGKTRRKQLIDWFGGCCQYCGQKKSQRLLFHHLLHREHDRKFEITVSNLRRPHNQIAKEAAICSLTCDRCHELIHKELLWDMSYLSNKFNAMVNPITGKLYLIKKSQMRRHLRTFF